MLSVVKDQEFKIPSASAISIAIPQQAIFNVFASEKTVRSGLNGSDVPKHHPYYWHKEGPIST